MKSTRPCLWSCFLVQIWAQDHFFSLAWQYMIQIHSNCKWFKRLHTTRINRHRPWNASKISKPFCVGYFLVFQLLRYFDFFLEIFQNTEIFKTTNKKVETTKKKMKLPKKILIPSQKNLNQQFFFETTKKNWTWFVFEDIQRLENNKKIS